MNPSQGAVRERWMPPFVSTALNSSHHVSALQGPEVGEREHLRRCQAQGVEMTVVWTLRPNG